MPKHKTIEEVYEQLSRNNFKPAEVFAALTEAEARGAARERKRIGKIVVGVRDAFALSLDNAVNDQKAPYRHALQAVDEEILQALTDEPHEP